MGDHPYKLAYSGSKWVQEKSNSLGPWLAQSLNMGGLQFKHSAVLRKPTQLAK